MRENHLTSLLAHRGAAFLRAEERARGIEREARVSCVLTVPCVLWYDMLRSVTILPRQSTAPSSLLYKDRNTVYCLFYRINAHSTFNTGYVAPSYPFQFLGISMGSSSSCTASRFHLTAQDIVKGCGAAGQLKHLHILVTGASSGIAIETGRVLASNEAKVYMMGRSEGKLNEVIQDLNQQLQQQGSAGSVQGVICDLNSLASIKRFAESFVNNNAPLNILVLNAGIINYNFAQTVYGLEQAMGVNHIGQAYLTQLLLPKLQASAPSRRRRRAGALLPAINSPGRALLNP